MTLEELKALLEAGKITQVQFDALAAALTGGGDDAGKAGGEKPAGEPDAPGAGAPDMERLVQQAVDRATTKLGQDNKALREKLSKLEREKLGEEEVRKLELAEKEQEMAAREAELKDRENRLYAVKAIKTAGLDDGGEQSLALVDFVLGKDEGEIDKRVKAFGELVKRFVQADVDKLFKENGGTPQRGAPGGAGEPNPWKKETFNMTEQTKIELEDPVRAKALMAAAGVGNKK